MTEKKKMKQRIRARMQKTGESYTTARRVVAAEEEPFDLSDYYELMSRAPVPEDDPIVKQAEAELRRRGWVQAQLDEAIEFGLGDAKVELAIHGKWKRPQDSEWLHREDAVWEELDAPRRKREALPKGSIEATAAYRTIVTERVMVRKDGESWVPAVPREKGIFERAEKVYLPDKTCIKDVHGTGGDLDTLHLTLGINSKTEGHPDSTLRAMHKAIRDLRDDIAKSGKDVTFDTEAFKTFLDRLLSMPPKVPEHPDTRALRNVCRIVDLSMDAARCLADGPPPPLTKKQRKWAQKIVESAEWGTQKPVPEPSEDPHGYLLYVLNDLRALVKHAKPSDLALTSRFDCIEHVVAELFAPSEKVSVTLGPQLPDGHVLSEEMLTALAKKMGGSVEDGHIVATLPVEDPRTQDALKGEVGISVSAKGSEQIRRGDTLVRGEERLLVVGETKGGVLVVPLQDHMSLWRSKAIELSLHGIESALKGGKLKIEKFPEELRNSDLSDLQPIALREAVSGLLDNLHRGDWNVAKDYWEEVCLLSGRFEMEPHPWLKKLFETPEGVTIKAYKLPPPEEETTEDAEAAVDAWDKYAEQLERMINEMKIKAEPFPPVPGPGVHTVPEPELHWIWSPDKTGESARGYYHAYTEGESPYPRSVFSHITRTGTASLCGEYHTVTMETKTPGAPKCPKCEEFLRKRGMGIDEIRNRLIRLAQERPDLKPLDIKTAMRKNDLSYEECVELFGKEGADAIFGVG